MNINTNTTTEIISQLKQCGGILNASYCINHNHPAVQENIDKMRYLIKVLESVQSQK